MSLNEIFAAEVDSGKTSVYSLEIDGKKIGKFVSSGIIVSTGSGSTAWLQSARRISYSNIQGLLENIGAYSSGDDYFQDKLEETIAGYIWKHYYFPPDHDQMYYFNRDLYSENNRVDLSTAQYGGGYCRQLKVQSEIENGQVYLDGFSQHKLNIGDVFTLECRPEHQLRCIRFL
mmetsp:Transcript_41100/g.39617  ORF Transcript_41100/g.39617 Transcript_41100/m.39617 type:complete len:174 (+) Transcript_41100:430-951(+)